MEVLKLLVARGADITCKDKKGYTLLHTAAASGQIEVVKHLLRLGVEASVMIVPVLVDAGLLCTVPILFSGLFPSDVLVYNFWQIRFAVMVHMCVYIKSLSQFCMLLVLNNP